MNILGLMSGTSLDGVDLALCSFTLSNNLFQYEIIQTELVDYPKETIIQLKDAINLSAADLAELDHTLGRWYGKIIVDFIEKYNLKVDLIASHGHTVFHQPGKMFTKQIGHGAAIYAASGISVVSDFRTTDVNLGGQGAPLVPIGDKYLFAEYEACINLGGFVNISEKKDKIIAYDICANNVVLNALCNLHFNTNYDKDGQLASQGVLVPELFEKLNLLPYYAQKPPKSLGMEWVKQFVFPLITNHSYKGEDILHTYVQHVAFQISRSTEYLPKGSKILATGGGAHNKYLIESIKKHSNKIEIVVPSTEVVDFKEALIFAFLGFLRINDMCNCLSSVTGANNDNIGGAIFGKIGHLISVPTKS